MIFDLAFLEVLEAKMTLDAVLGTWRNRVMMTTTMVVVVLMMPSPLSVIVMMRA